MFRRGIERGRNGEIRLRLDDDERSLLEDVATEVEALLGEEPGDPSLRRLFPPAHDDVERESEYRDLTHAQLLSGRERALQTLRETADNEVLSEEEADAWLRALNDARLVLGTKLDITEDFDWDGFDARHPRAPELALYAYLSWLQEQLVEAV